MSKNKIILSVLVMLVSIVVLVQAATINTASSAARTYLWRSSGTHTSTESSTLLCSGVACKAGTYLVAADLGVNTVYTAGSAVLTITVNDGVTSKTLVLPAVTISTLGASSNAVGLFDLATGGVFTASLAVTGLMGSGTFYENVSYTKVR